MFRELITEDVAIELLKLYKKIDPGYIPKRWNDFKKDLCCLSY